MIDMRDSIKSRGAWPRLTISARVWLIVLANFLLLALMALFAYTELQSIAKAVRQIANVDEPTRAAVQELKIQSNAYSQSVFSFIDTKDQEYIETSKGAVEEFSTYAKEFRLLIPFQVEEYRAILAELATTLEVTFKKLQESASELIEISATRDQAINESLLNSVRTKASEIDTLIDEEIRPLIELSVQASSLSAREAAQHATETVIFLGIIAVIISIGSAVLLARRITKSASSLRDGTAIIAKGELEHRVDVGGNDEMSELARSINLMASQRKEAESKLVALAARLKEAERLEVIGTLTSVIAHQLKNPLSIIKGAISSIKRRSTEPDKDTQKFIDILEHESERTANLLERFLEFAKKQNLVRSNFSLKAFVIDAVDTLKAMHPGIEVSVGLGDEIEINADRALLMEALLNLLENAHEATVNNNGACPHVDLESFIEDNDLCLSVSDRGKGLTAESLGRIFEPFYTTKSKGSGLGLSMAKKIVSLHGGTLELKNKKDKSGAVATLKLPLNISETKDNASIINR